MQGQYFSWVFIFFVCFQFLDFCLFDFINCYLQLQIWYAWKNTQLTRKFVNYNLFVCTKVISKGGRCKMMQWILIVYISIEEAKATFQKDTKKKKGPSLTFVFLSFYFHFKLKSMGLCFDCFVGVGRLLSYNIGQHLFEGWDSNPFKDFRLQIMFENETASYW
jgi:hypothetical protein